MSEEMLAGPTEEMVNDWNIHNDHSDTRTDEDMDAEYAENYETAERVVTVKQFAHKVYTQMAFFQLMLTARGLESDDAQRCWRKLVKLVAVTAEMEGATELPDD